MGMYAKVENLFVNFGGQPYRFSGCTILYSHLDGNVFYMCLSNFNALRLINKTQPITEICTLYAVFHYNLLHLLVILHIST